MKLQYVGHHGKDAPMIVPVSGVIGGLIEQGEDGYYDVPDELAHQLLQQYEAWRRAPAPVVTPKKAAEPPRGKE